MDGILWIYFFRWSNEIENLRIIDEDEVDQRLSEIVKLVVPEKSIVTYQIIDENFLEFELRNF